MKIGKLGSYAILILFAFVLLFGCVTTKNIISEEDFFKIWSGTWVNTDIPGSVWEPQKLICRPDGTFDTYVYVDLTTPFCNHKIELLDQWIDSEDTTWYSAKWICLIHEHSAYQYGKISDFGNTLEFITQEREAPIEKWEPDNEWYNYSILYRE
jgi:hypothetical protein